MSPRVERVAHLAVRRVRNGHGIVALKSFAGGARLCVLRGAIISTGALWRMWDANPSAAANCFRISAEKYLDPQGYIGAFANHSCRPNAALLKEGRQLVMRALVPIAAHEEVTHDYSTLLGADDIWTMRCNCGERGCRRVVQRFDRLSAEALRRYQAVGAIPRHILATR